MKSLFHRMAVWPVAFSLVAAVFLVVLNGCKTRGQYPSVAEMTAPAHGTNDVVLKEGDVVRVTFPNAEMNRDETIRRDGKITLPIIGDVPAAGKTPRGFQHELAEKYSKEIRSSDDISVILEASAFPVYVSGAVMHPGKVTGDHALTVLEAIMEAGGYDADKAQLKSVKVVRTENGKTHTFIIDLRGVQSPGKPVNSFYLHPADIVIVPQKFVLF